MNLCARKMNGFAGGGVARPALWYTGSKWKIAQWVMGFFPAHRVYVEPFGGAAGVLLQKEPVPSEIYNDANGELVNFFRVLRDHGGELRRKIELTPYAREEQESAYEPSNDPIEQARRTAVKAFMSFGGMGVISNSAFALSVADPFHNSWSNDWRGYSDALPALTSRLRHTSIEHGDALPIIERFGAIEDALIYADPPYLGTMGYKFAHDHDALIDVLKQCRAYVVLSGYAGGGIDGWECHTKTSRTGNSAAGPRTEHLWLSPKTSEALRREREQKELF